MLRPYSSKDGFCIVDILGDLLLKLFRCLKVLNIPQSLYYFYRKTI